MIEIDISKKIEKMTHDNKLYGAILGDLAGQPFEFPAMKGPYTNVELHNPKSVITDDTYMTLASAAYLLGRFPTLEHAYKDMGKRYPGDHYGKKFKEWLSTPIPTVSDSWGNGCLMRISPFMYLKDGAQIRQEVLNSCFTSHYHPKSVIAALDLVEEYKGAKIRRYSIKYSSSSYVKRFTAFETGAEPTLEFVKNAYWLTKSTELAIVAVIGYGGDTDTNASIIGELMNYTFNDLSPKSVEYVESKLDPYLMSILNEFNEKF